MLIEETSIPLAGLPLDAFKAHLRMGTGFGQDDVQDVVLTAFLRAAYAAVEARTGKALIVRGFSLTVASWAAQDAQALPMAPVTEITQVEQVAAGGARLTVDPASYWLERDGQRPQLRATGASLPRIDRGGSVVIAFQAGIATGWTGLPSDLQQAVLMLAAHYYEYRNDTGLSDGCMPFGVTSLLERYRDMRLGVRA